MAEYALAQKSGVFDALRLIARVTLLPVVLAAALVLALVFGPVSIAPLQIVQILLYKLSIPGVHATASAANIAIIWEIRLPRVIAAALVGAALAVAGALFQAVLRNPLADPYVIGTSAGAQLGVALTLVLPIQFSLLGFAPLQFAAFGGALATVLLVYLIARTGGATPVVTLILAGFVVSSFLISATTFITYAGGHVADRLTEILGWTMGDVQVESWNQLAVSAPAILVAAGLAFLLAPKLNLILLGESQAAHLGVHVERLKLVAIVLASLLTALAVTLAGIVAFVGLVVPHAIRLLYGPGHRVLLPSALVGGAAFVVLCDAVGQVVIAPSTIPLGVITAVLGAPFFLFLLRRSRRDYAI